ncbi:MAG TPA: lanthionine synthetase C family protein [Streptosporangiaceae bacterium]
MAELWPTPEPVAVRTDAPPVRARRVIREITTRLGDDARLRRAIERSAAQTAYPEVNVWRAESVAYGAAGLAAVFAAADQADPGRGLDTLAHGRLAAAVQALPGATSLGLFDGACGVAFAAALASKGGRRYTGLLTGLDERIARQAGARARLMAASDDPVPVPAYDVVSGAAGWALYLAGRPSTPPVEEALGDLERLLTRLAGRDERGTPRLALPARLLSAELAGLAPDGYVDCGVAHGYPGVLAALLALRARRVRTGGAPPAELDDALGGGAAWLSARLIEGGEGGPYWPYRVLLGADGAARTRAHLRPHDGWCYGTPGVARVLWSAGTVLGEPAYVRTAVAALEAACERTLRNVVPGAPPSPTLCHGRAGLYVITASLASASPRLASAADRLLDALLAAYDDDAPLGYRDVENAGTVTDGPGLLSGAPGVALALLTAADPDPADGARWSGTLAFTGATPR